MSLPDARTAYWRAWIHWYQVFNDDRRGVRRTADAMRAYLGAKAGGRG